MAPSGAAIAGGAGTGDGGGGVACCGNGLLGEKCSASDAGDWIDRVECGAIAASGRAAGLAGAVAERERCVARTRPVRALDATERRQPTVDGCPASLGG